MFIALFDDLSLAVEAIANSVELPENATAEISALLLVVVTLLLE